jgi:predicted phosphodiesterase
MKSSIRVIVPDSHGEHIDPKAAAAILADIKALCPDEVVLLGDHLDCGGTFNAHQRNYTKEMTESYDSDVRACNGFLDNLQDAAPNGVFHYLFGNHEEHVERWAARAFFNKSDADMLLAEFGPAAVLGLKKRDIRWYRSSEHYMGLSVPGTIKLGKCYFTHGVSHSRHAAYAHLQRFGANVVFGHVHRSQSVVERTVTSDGYGAWCPGTLAKLQPLYRHTAPTSWSHGYAVQFVNCETGTFLHLNVPIVKGSSLLLTTVDAIQIRKNKKRSKK